MRTVLPSCLFLLGVTWAPMAACGESHQRLQAGAYSFSDELGGFILRGVSGTGTRSDPFVIDQELLSASPVTLVVRVAAPIVTHGPSGLYANGLLHVRLRTLNNSGVPWMEYEIELQERLGQPSVHGDGLSFDQRRTTPESRWSDTFRLHDTDYEPFDRLVFRDGHVDPGATAVFAFFVTDFTPKLEFYIRQDPRIPLG